MEDTFLKKGSFSSVLKYEIFKKFKIKQAEQFKDNLYILKITNDIDNFKEIEILNIVKKLKNHEKYFNVIESEIYELKNNNEISIYMKDLFNQKIISRNVYIKSNIYYFMKTAGNRELFDSFIEISNNNLNIWKDNTYDKLKIFIDNILSSINFLHKNKIGHFDIKPENIIICNESIEKDNINFKLIDFGFSDVYPFTKYLEKSKGTPEYFPKYIQFVSYNEFLPAIYTNDWSNDYNHISKKTKEFELIYKTDIYSFGRTIYYLNKLLEKYKLYNESKILFLTNQMTHSNIYERYNIDDCLSYNLDLESKENIRTNLHVNREINENENSKNNKKLNIREYNSKEIKLNKYNYFCNCFPIHKYLFGY